MGGIVVNRREGLNLKATDTIGFVHQNWSRPIIGPAPGNSSSVKKAVC